MVQRIHDMPFGARLDPAGGAEFRLWAPALAQVRLELREGDAAQELAMQAQSGGWHRLQVPHARAGDAYRFVLPDGRRVPDPASRYNPGDVHGASQLVDPRTYEWGDAAWRGRPWHEAVVYELHVGAFTGEGSYAAAAQRLPQLAALGITAVELMPLSDFPGRRGWGYDGVLPFAPEAGYGPPQALKAFVDCAHGLGLMVLLDVVYNHFGPEGNYLHAYCPQFFNPAHPTPWGAAINFDGPDSRTVRDFHIHNALYWIEEFHFDGLRLDAVHAIADDSSRHIVRELCDAVQRGPGSRRQVHIVLENDANQATLLARGPHGQPLAATAQWNDDLHHAAHVLLTGEADGYYADFAGDPVAGLARALAEGFIYQGQPSALRDGQPRGEDSAQLPLAAFVSYLQTHDQVGNRAFGDRLHALADPVLLQAVQACVLLSPHVPMLFMGEEFAASTPFLYFCDFGPDLAQAVSRGRREEFGRFAAFADPAVRERIPDPNDEASWRACILRWDERDHPPHDEALARTRQLLAVRHRELMPLFAQGCHGGEWQAAAGLLQVGWRVGHAGARLHLWANLGPQDAQLLPPAGRLLHVRGLAADAGASPSLARGGVVVWLQEARHA